MRVERWIEVGEEGVVGFCVCGGVLGKVGMMLLSY